MGETSSSRSVLSFLFLMNCLWAIVFLKVDLMLRLRHIITLSFSLGPTFWACLCSCMPIEHAFAGRSLCHYSQSFGFLTTPLTLQAANDFFSHSWNWKLPILCISISTMSAVDQISSNYAFSKILYKLYWALVPCFFNKPLWNWNCFLYPLCFQTFINLG